MSDPTAETSHVGAEAPRDEGAPVPEAGLLGRLIDKGGLIFALGIVAAMLILIQEVFLRYVFNAPTIWAHETTVFLCGIAFIYGGLYCTARDRHIRVVLIYDALGPRMRRTFDVVISIICALASLMFTWAAWTMVARAAFAPGGEVRLERSGSAWNPPYPGMLKIFLMLVLGVMAVQFVILAVSYARRGR
ncbi:TRAP dicarboxylate family transporter, DctQ subunit [Oceanicola granulosus HTCC2516]|uniref:TRAP transporter small permease protein n=1 Tax=Oceanicola granulosus (strain ATCC BAA-861 / DSM 15982 / KCTC 12143 / HTCC2516) TaxID=314256 RepID=Q2CBQ4_OCEGH|nr:TRAP transporter small permease [Oceanicola granulosus]EAR50077.1 TRAP dicarboxylate family transporter, DctQ subunit [Oceanicola granulosus HTCC2516]